MNTPNKHILDLANLSVSTSLAIPLRSICCVVWAEISGVLHSSSHQHTPRQLATTGVALSFSLLHPPRELHRRRLPLWGLLSRSMRSLLRSALAIPAPCASMPTCASLPHAHTWCSIAPTSCAASAARSTHRHYTLPLLFITYCVTIVPCRFAAYRRAAV